MYAYCLCMLFYNVSMVRFMNSCQDIGFSSLLQSISILKLGELKSFMLCVCCMSSGSDLKDGMYRIGLFRMASWSVS